MFIPRPQTTFRPKGGITGQCGYRRSPPWARNTRIIGLDVRTSGVDLGFTLGYRDASLLAHVPVGESIYMRLSFLPDDGPHNPSHLLSRGGSMLANRYPRQHFGAALATLLAIPLAACFGQDKLYISSTTVLGSGRQRQHRAYRWPCSTRLRSPLRNLGAANGEQRKGRRGEVMSALNCTEVVVSGLTLTKFDESLATGTAAILFAQKIAESQNSTPYFECFTDQQAGR
jgi:hypothetical protein